MPLAPNECTICKHECCKYEFWSDDPKQIAILGGDGYWWCDACDCHWPKHDDWWDAWDTIDV